MLEEELVSSVIVIRCHVTQNEAHSHNDILKETMQKTPHKQHTPDDYHTIIRNTAVK